MGETKEHRRATTPLSKVPPWGRDAPPQETCATPLRPWVGGSRSSCSSAKTRTVSMATMSAGKGSYRRGWRSAPWQQNGPVLVDPCALCVCPRSGFPVREGLAFGWQTSPSFGRRRRDAELVYGGELPDVSTTGSSSPSGPPLLGPDGAARYEHSLREVFTQCRSFHGSPAGRRATHRRSPLAAPAPRRRPPRVHRLAAPPSTGMILAVQELSCSLIPRPPIPAGSLVFIHWLYVDGLRHFSKLSRRALQSERATYPPGSCPSQNWRPAAPVSWSGLGQSGRACRSSHPEPHPMSSSP